MNMQKKKLPCQDDLEDRKQGGRDESADLSLTGILQELTPSIEAFLEKSAENQKNIIAADLKIAESVSRLTDHIVSEKSSIHLHLYPGPFQKKSKKSRDPHHLKVKKIILKMRKRLKTYEEIAQFLEKEKIQTFTKQGRWHAQTVHRLFQDYPES